jgi:hypothetical protein
MRRLKKVAAIVSLAVVISMGASVALAGTIEAPGHSVRMAVGTSDASVTGVVEAPGFDETILITIMLMM